MFQKAEGDVDKNRSVWGSVTPGDIKKVYGRAFHPFAEEGQFGNSKNIFVDLACASTKRVYGGEQLTGLEANYDYLQLSTNRRELLLVTSSRKWNSHPCTMGEWHS